MSVEDFLREHRYGMELSQMLRHNSSLDYWKTLWETYHDLGGNLCPDGMRVRTPWAGPPPEYWSGDQQGEAAMNRYLKQKKSQTDSSDSGQGSAREFLSQHRSGFILEVMLEHNSSLEYWKDLWKTYGDLGGHMCPDGTRVRTPWAGPPPEYWSGDAKGELALKRYLRLRSPEKDMTASIGKAMEPAEAGTLMITFKDGVDQEAILKRIKGLEVTGTDYLGGVGIGTVRVSDLAAFEPLLQTFDGVASVERDAEVSIAEPSSSTRKRKLEQ